jgi:hypothetical protein
VQHKVPTKPGRWKTLLGLPSHKTVVRNVFDDTAWQRDRHLWVLPSKVFYTGQMRNEDDGSYQTTTFYGKDFEENLKNLIVSFYRMQQDKVEKIDMSLCYIDKTLLI